MYLVALGGRAVGRLIQVDAAGGQQGITSGVTAEIPAVCMRMYLVQVDAGGHAAVAAITTVLDRFEG